MKCIVLAAGYATRLYPLTEHYPKPLLEISGKTILDRLLDDPGVRRAADGIIVVTNHRFAGVLNTWAEGREYPVRIIDDGTTDNSSRLGAVRDLELALRAGSVRDEVLAMAGDNVIDFSLEGFICFARERRASCVMCHEERNIEALRKTAVITRDESGLILSYDEKPENPAGHLAVPPFYFYRPEDAARISEALAEGCAADSPGSFAAWLSRRVPMYAYLMPGRRYDIGDPESLETARRSIR